MSDVTQLAALAAKAEAPALDDVSARRMIDRALVASRQVEHVRRRWIAVPMIAVVAIAVLVVLSQRPPRERPDAPVLQLTLPTGDRLAATSGAQFDIAEITPASRRLRVSAGSILFDVAHVVPGQRFEVTTPHAVVRAKGTIFSVTIAGDTTSVFVVQGVVEIDHGHETHVLAAGRFWRGSAPSVVATTAVADAGAPRVNAAPAVTKPPPPTVVVAAPAAAAGIASHPLHRDHTDEPSKLPPPTLARAQAHILAGRFEAALEEARRAGEQGPLTGAWHVLIGDAHRGLGHPGDAADAFASAVPLLTGDARAEAAYSAASLRFRDLRDGEAALAALTAGEVDAAGSALEERGLGLRVQILASMGRSTDAHSIAEHYLARFPRGGLASLMHSLLRPPPSPR